MTFSLVARCAPDGEKWSENAKTLYIRGNKLTYDIGWLGAISGGPRVANGKEHTAVLVSEGGHVTLYVNGKRPPTAKASPRPTPWAWSAG